MSDFVFYLFVCVFRFWDFWIVPKPNSCMYTRTHICNSSWGKPHHELQRCSYMHAVVPSVFVSSQDSTCYVSASVIALDGCRGWWGCRTWLCNSSKTGSSISDPANISARWGCHTSSATHLNEHQRPFKYPSTLFHAPWGSFLKDELLSFLSPKRCTLQEPAVISV